MNTSAKRFGASFMALITLFCSLIFAAPTASAATSSYRTETRTIYVTTKGGIFTPNIKLSQSKGTRTSTTYNPITGKTKTKTTKRYGHWNIVATASNGSTSKYTLKGSSLKIKLKKNESYTITVSWDSDYDTIESTRYGTFESYPTWKVKSTYKVLECH